MAGTGGIPKSTITISIYIYTYPMDPNSSREGTKPSKSCPKHLLRRYLDPSGYIHTYMICIYLLLLLYFHFNYYYIFIVIVIIIIII
jgi:uncharacterized membrane protein YdbT with pleckstrin-like domain